jgi:ATP-dependent Lon protease
LFQPLPPEFDLAIMDRFACYLPGWEMPKNSSEFLTSKYGFITDYLAEAFHHAFKHTNRYEEVNKRIRLGSSIEGRDEKGIKKTVCAFLKILHPSGTPTDEEFETYVAYAVECRRRIKEQMNKRKTDDEFAMINLSYVNNKGDDIIVYCPESQHAPATQHPSRRTIGQSASEQSPAVKTAAVKTVSAVAASNQNLESAASDLPGIPAIEETGPNEQHFTILYGDIGYSYESIVGPYLNTVKEVVVEDPYIRVTYQIQNFVRFCETLLKTPTLKKITLVTTSENKAQQDDMQDKLGELQQSLLEMDIVLEIAFTPHLHDREIRLDNGWIIKIGRGLDFYQKPGSRYAVGSNDLSLRKCLETKVDIYKIV